MKTNVNVNVNVDANANANVSVVAVGMVGTKQKYFVGYRWDGYCKLLLLRWGILLYSSQHSTWRCQTLQRSFEHHPPVSELDFCLEKKKEKKNTKRW